MPVSLSVLAITGAVPMKVAVIAAFTATPVALLAGLVDETVGGVVSVPPPPVLLHDISSKPINKAATMRQLAWVVLM